MFELNVEEYHYVQVECYIYIVLKLQVINMYVYLQENILIMLYCIDLLH